MSWLHLWVLSSLYLMIILNTGNPPKKKAKVLLPCYMDKFSTPPPKNQNDESVIIDDDEQEQNSSTGKFIQNLRQVLLTTIKICLS